MRKQEKSFNVVDQWWKLVGNIGAWPPHGKDLEAIAEGLQMDDSGCCEVWTEGTYWQAYSDLHIVLHRLPTHTCVQNLK